MKIVILDGYTENPGDLSWDGLKALGDELTVYDRTPRELIVERSKGAEVIFTNKTPLDDKTIKELPGLRYIGVLATGYNVVDINAARELGITVTNIPTYGTLSVAQMTFAHILELCHKVQRHSDAVKEGKWAKCPDFCFWDYPLVELAGLTMGIIGFGRIGQQVARIANAFGMKVLAYDANRFEAADIAFNWAELDELLGNSDVVSLHCPLFPETKGIINKDTLKKMKRTAVLINTSRGPLIDEKALADALNNEEIAGAGLDVLCVEPPAADNPLMLAKNCIITPHISWATKAARARLMDIAVDNLRQFLRGNSVNVIK